MSDAWWHKWENVAALITAGSGAALIVLHVVLQANGQGEVSKYLDGIGLTGSVGVMALMGSGVFAALQRQTAYLQAQVHQQDKMIDQGEKAPAQIAHVAKVAAKEAATEVLTESKLVNEKGT